MESGNLGQSGSLTRRWTHDMSLRKKYSDLITTHSETVNKLLLAQEELTQLKQDYNEVVQERNSLQCTGTIRMKWESAIQQINEYKEVLGQLNQQQEESTKDSIKYRNEIKCLKEERDAALEEISLILSERDIVHGEIEKLNQDLIAAKSQTEQLDKFNKELTEKFIEASHDAQVSKKRRDWAFSERDRVVREYGALKVTYDGLGRERDKAVSDLAEALCELQYIKGSKNDVGPRSSKWRGLHSSKFSGFSESRDSAIDSDVTSDSGFGFGHHQVKLPILHGVDHGLVLDTGVYISRIIPDSPAAKVVDSSLSIGDRILAINDIPIETVQDAILALSKDPPHCLLTLTSSQTSGQLPQHTFVPSASKEPLQNLHCKSKSLSTTTTNANVMSMNSNFGSLDLSVKSGNIDQMTLDRFRTMLSPSVGQYQRHSCNYEEGNRNQFNFTPIPMTSLGGLGSSPGARKLTSPVPWTLNHRFPHHHHHHNTRGQVQPISTLSMTSDRNKLKIFPVTNFKSQPEDNLLDNPISISNHENHWPGSSNSIHCQDMRIVQIEKFDKPQEPLGIQISCKANGGGVYVSYVTKNSMAALAGLQVGDQLLEVCGINLRFATYSLAANVLSHCGDAVTMLVQYCPSKYKGECLNMDGDENYQVDEVSQSSLSMENSFDDLTLVRQNSKEKSGGEREIQIDGGGGQGQSNQVTQFLNERGNLTISGTVRQLSSEDVVYVWKI